MVNPELSTDIVINRRNQARYPVSARAHVIAPECSFEAKLVEISVVGIRLRCDQSLKPATQVDIIFSLKDTIHITGKVLWAIHVFKDRGQFYYEMGIGMNAIAVSDLQASDLLKKKKLFGNILMQAQ